MHVTIEAINHVGLVVRDLKQAEAFYMGVLGLKRHHTRTNWLVLNARSTLHLIPRSDPAGQESDHHAYRHVALEVSDLKAVLQLLLNARMRVFQADFSGGEGVVSTVGDSLDFGVGTLFVRDPDGNLLEFLQIGRGIFTAENQPRP